MNVSNSRRRSPNWSICSRSREVKIEEVIELGVSITLGLDEACTNVIRYAYHQQTNQLIALVCDHHGDRIVFRLRDYGAQCDPAQLNGRPLDLVQPGGLGIHLIKRAFDQVDYNLKREGTELVLTKHFAGDPAVAKPHRRGG